MSQDITINRYADFLMNVNILGYTDTTYEAKAHIKKVATEVTPFMEFTITKLEENPGCMFSCSLTALQTADLVTKGITALDLERYVYDIVITDSVGRIFRVLQGNVLVSPGVTIAVVEPPLGV